MSVEALTRSRALWNRSAFDPESDEILAQILDRGELAAWRELYALACSDAALRRRIARIVATVPLPLPRFWLALLAGMGEVVDFGAVPPADDGGI